jgi:hypothetical protein
MASYFVACHAPPDGIHAVHDRDLCPPACFPYDGATEYLGEYIDAMQAVSVARLRYPHAAGCSCCAQPAPRMPALPTLTPARP